MKTIKGDRSIPPSGGTMRRTSLEDRLRQGIEEIDQCAREFVAGVQDAERDEPARHDGQDNDIHVKLDQGVEDP